MLALRRLRPLLGAQIQVRRHLSQVQFTGPWPCSEKREFQQDMRVIPEFITAEEEQSLLQEIEPRISRLPYETSHWDEAIHGYRETEHRQWNLRNREVLDKVSREAFNGQVMPFVHILDLAESGVIKPHVDSSRFCGNTIAGLSLLSDCVMRLVRVKSDTDLDSEEALPHSADLLLPRRSLYVMRELARYKFTHEILARELSEIWNKPVTRNRRLSVICRNEP